MLCGCPPRRPCQAVSRVRLSTDGRPRSRARAACGSSDSARARARGDSGDLARSARFDAPASGDLPTRAALPHRDCTRSRAAAQGLHRPDLYIPSSSMEDTLRTTISPGQQGGLPPVISSAAKSWSSTARTPSTLAGITKPEGAVTAAFAALPGSSAPRAASANTSASDRPAKTASDAATSGAGSRSTASRSMRALICIRETDLPSRRSTSWYPREG